MKLLLIGFGLLLALATAPQAAPVGIYFNHDPRVSYQEPYRKITRAGYDFEEILSQVILSAKKSIDVAIYELRLPKIAHALAIQHKKGIQVRIITENTNRRPWSSLTPEEVAKLTEMELGRYKEAFALIDMNRDSTLSDEEIHTWDALVVLSDARVPLVDDTSDGSKGSGLMHHKFLVIDGEHLWTGSANLTTSCTHGDFLNPNSRGNQNSLSHFESRELAALFTEEFNQMWNQHVFGLKKTPRPPRTVVVDGASVTVQFSPISERRYGFAATVNGLIERALRTTRQSVDLAQFVFSEQRLVDAIQPLNTRGERIRTLIDPWFAYRDYSELLDMFGLKMLSARCTYEPGNLPWTRPITSAGIPLQPDGDKLHHKFAVLDNQRVIFGSHNWSASANNLNDEALLVVDSPQVAAAYRFEFERLYSNSVLGIKPWLTQKISEIEKKCTTQPIGVPHEAVDSEPPYFDEY